LFFENMPTSLTPEPRLPLEPEEYPLYRPPSRIGCSALSLVTLITVAVFSLLFWQVTPRIVQGISSFSLGSLTGDTTPQAAAGGALATQTVTETGTLNATAVPARSPTPVRVCVKVTGTGGAGTALKSAARSTASNVIKDGNGKVGEGATFQIIGADVVSGKDSAGQDIVWRQVMLPGDGRSGYVLGKFVQPAPCP
jgi:hypothetical protein